MACSENKNPLQRGGTSQQQRELAALKEGYVSIEERDYAEWIVFANEFAAYLNYYDAQNEASGNWKPFFQSDVSALLGAIAIQDIDAYRRSLSDRFAILKADEFASNITLKRETLGGLFGALMTICKAFDNKIASIPSEISLKCTIQNLIAVKLQPALLKLLSYYKAGKSLNLIKEKDLPDWKVLGLPVLKASTRIAEGLSGHWIKDASGWEDYYTAIQEDASIYGDPLWSNHRKINHLAGHNLFTGLFDQFLLSYAKVIKEAENSLLATLNNRNTHLPHYALFLTFLKLFRFAKQHSNTLTKRHLDFYYKEVLHLFPKKAVENKAHIVLELAKQMDAYLLKKGSLLKAGKDSQGKEVSYELGRDVVFNKAKVAKLMTVYKGTVADNILPVVNKGRLFAAPVVNSADGMGAALESPYKEWHPFVSKKYTEGALNAVSLPKASIGLAVASHYLFLTEGERTVSIKFAAVFSAAQHTALNQAECWLTSEKGWIKVDSFSWTSGLITGTTTAATILTFTLAGDVPAITNYVPKAHGGTFSTDLPMLRVLLRNDDAGAYGYDLLKDVVIAKVEVEVKVGLNASDAVTVGGMKNLSLSNDIGVLDPSKPFLPFGPAPVKGNSLLIGNEEVFKKKNAKILFRVEWKGLPDEAFDIDYNYGEYNPVNTAYVDENPKTHFFSLQQGVWQEGVTDAGILSDFVYNYVTGTFSPNKEVLTFPESLMALPDGVISDHRQPYKPYDITAIKGYLKLTLNSGFGHQEYQKALTAYLIALAKGSIASEPTEPYTPTIKKMTLHYKAFSVGEVASSAAFDNRAVQFFHIYPFGEMEQHRKLSNSEVRFLPQFTDAKNKTLHNEGEFYIGLTDLQGGQSVNVLFQVLEGTTDPLLEKPKEHLSWSYLKNNQWTVFKNENLSDQTSQLLKSGIISFVIPADAGTVSTVLPSGYLWIRAAVKEKSESVCRLMAVLAQAAVVTYKDRDNATDFLDTALPAGTVSKLKEASSAVKKIEQPYASFGGRANEAEEAYYVRVSERLRHKARAITIWDYEHLVLEAFPDIHRVKCLNHTKFEGNDYNEVAPGHVTVITIPNLQNRNDANPLRPYTNQDVLTGIYDFLKAKLSCHVKLHVRHPQFEEVRLDFKLKLFPGLEFNFYRELLQQEITAYLTPWAYGQSGNVEFGGRVHKSVLINFIEERSYVDYITDVKMYHRIGEAPSVEGSDTDQIEAATGRSVLVSAPKNKHAIAKISEVLSGTVAEDCTDEYNRGNARLRREIKH